MTAPIPEPFEIPFPPNPPEPPKWINFEHPEFPRYFSIVVLNADGSSKYWWQRLPKELHTEVI